MQHFFSPFYRLMRLCVQGRSGKIGIAQFVFVFALSLAGLAISIRLIRWSNDFYNALQEVNGNAIIGQIGIFAVLTLLSASLHLIGKFVQNLLEIRWRNVLTDIIIERWLHKHKHWYISLKKSTTDIDNPEQRIAEDCRVFIHLSVTQVHALLMAIISVVSYFSVLYSLSTFALSFSVLGYGVEIPRYMVWAAPIYVLLSSGVTHFLGAPLRDLTVKQQRKEADFRYALTRIRDTSEAIALQRGEPFERQYLKKLFQAIEHNWRNLNIRNLLLGVFTRPYYQTVLRIPMFLALPAFIAGKVSLGGLMQLASAFTKVVTTLSWFIFSYRDLAELAASTRRLDQLLQEVTPDLTPNTELAMQTGSDLIVQDLQLSTPSGTPLLYLSKLCIQAGETIWLQGDSGIGKSTLLKTIAGLWPYASGTISHPKHEHSLYLPQTPYIPNQTLLHALCYPADINSLNIATATALLEKVGLEHLALIFNQTAEEQRRIITALSGGERQRLALARTLFLSPKWLFLDEATSALDAKSEQHILQELRKSLPHSSIILLSHRRPLGLGTYKHLQLNAKSANRFTQFVYLKPA